MQNPRNLANSTKDPQWTTSKVRQSFLSFFEKNGHTIVESGSLIPAGDKSLLFTNAGMVPFKDVFLGLEARNYNRATTSQRCVRAGGKHNDLDNVGYTARHHTFFEMLGNFSFGDYFKEQAILYCWEFLTEVLKLPPERLWITVFKDDLETEQIWKNKIGIDPARFSRCDEKDNFWSMGNTGPCGPCSEVFYDHGPEVAGGPPGSPEEDGDRYVEVWNLVFMQYNRSSNGSLSPLPKPSVDTGMGLERITAVLEHVYSNYDIDLFRHLIDSAHEIAPDADRNDPSFKVIADHIRSCAFLITDGVTPSNDGRGYVLRRILRRAIRHGHKLGIKKIFFHLMISPLEQIMGQTYPQLSQQQETLERVIRSEEERFRESLDNGLRIFEQEIASLKANIISGEILFKLYDTYGFPVDLTADIARERNLKVDLKGFEQCMEKQRNRARLDNQFVGTDANVTIEAKSDFVGYNSLETTSSIVLLLQDDKHLTQLCKGEEGLILLEQTPFYAESGGQVGDAGTIETANGVFQVLDTRKVSNKHLCIGKVVKGTINLGDACHARIDMKKREDITRNHSTTHLLHAALRNVLGDHVQQKGSLVNSNHLRFDFSHFSPLSNEELKNIEWQVNQHILANHNVHTEIMPLSEARLKGAMALFGEKYAEEVRVVSIDDFSIELCGGTHVPATGNIGYVKIITETGVSAGVRRIEALSGEHAWTWISKRIESQNELANKLNTSSDKLNEYIINQSEKIKYLEKHVETLTSKLNANQSKDIIHDIKQVKGVNILVKRLDNQRPENLRDLMDKLKESIGSGIILLASVNGEKITLVSGVTADLIDRYQANKWVDYVASQLGGKGGGQAHMAMAGATNIPLLDEVLAKSSDWL